MRVAFYKYHRPGLTGLFDTLIRNVTRGPYSHCELVFPDGMAYSSSIQDGGTRFKAIDFDPAKWDFVELYAVDVNRARKFCAAENGSAYDFPGVFRFLAAGIPESPERWFCSEVVCAALQEAGILWGANAWQIHPSKLYELISWSPDAR